MKTEYRLIKIPDYIEKEDLILLGSIQNEKKWRDRVIFYVKHKFNLNNHSLRYSRIAHLIVKEK